jgi:arylsulfatase A-like enzyme
VVVFVSDHGEELLEHGQASHGKQLYEELVRVPLILAGPGVPRGVRVEEPVSIRHVAHTAARLCGAGLGRIEDPLDLLARDGPERDRIVFSTRLGLWKDAGAWLFGLRRGPWVLHYAPLRDPSDPTSRTEAEPGRLRLFNLEEDPGQLSDRALDAPELAEELREELVETLEAGGRRRPALGHPADETTRKLLEALGYAGEER